MPAIPSNPSARRLVHTRRVECMGFERSDGLFDIEGRMRDTKSTDSDLLFKTVPAGSPIHDMRIVVTIDAKLVIRRIDAHSDAAPSRFCAEINHAYRSLEGLSIGAGFMKEVKSRLSGSKGCTHLTELLGPIATTAIQTLMGWRKPADAPNGADEGQPAVQAHPMIDTCHAWRAGGEVVQFALRRKHELAQGEAHVDDADPPSHRG
ncbi:DUF2889 domain-containing protein [Caballeronia novacaledonica]|uniref:DUF2889 domain-containing protein n=1 Tax=Caballeronia novacaledonica TaxID=1544861 RepID=UPI001EE2FD78|nr:DUF2889 domain-containing protein [Caballeronia novacaledonica]GJH08438.1 DUF2889 domain-containing protein [Caballeronia novacaledonica]